MKNNGKTNRTKGHNAEREYASKFRELAPVFGKCKTARAASRLHDDCGIDLCFTNPFNIQIKAGKQKGLSVPKELAKIRELVALNFPENYDEQTNINLLIHKREVGRGRRRNEFDDIVSMTFSDFEKLIKKVDL
tara:strand:- start:4074 stop:4475 length:402 start_codon:yes stop_codon:yes gene_type:complete